MLPAFEIVDRRRPVALVAPIARDVDVEGDVDHDLPRPAPYVAVQAEVSGPARLELTADGPGLAAVSDGRHCWLEIGGTRHRSRRYGALEAPADELALVVTGPQVTALTRNGDAWTARARSDLRELLPVHDESWCGALRVRTTGADRVQAGGYGQVGLRDLRLATTAQGSPVTLPDGRLVLTATHAGLGHFPTGHTGVWALDPQALGWEHLADLWFRRPDRPGVYGDHATHLVRDADRWLVATSTWGDFEPEPGRLRVTLATTDADLLGGQHVLDTEELPLPTGAERSVGVWDPHLVHTGTEWLVGFVSARRYFRFHPCLASGPDLARLVPRAQAARRRATEGTTLARLDGEWRVLASDGRDGRRGQQARWPVFNLALTEVASLDAPYPSNIPWPTLTRLPDGSWLWVTFNGRRWGGGLLGYGTHGEVVAMRSAPT